MRLRRAGADTPPLPLGQAGQYLSLISMGKLITREMYSTSYLRLELNWHLSVRIFFDMLNSDAAVYAVCWQNGVVLAREDWAGTSSVFHSILVQVVL